MRVANVIEEGRLGGPQIRIISVANKLLGKVETIVYLPKENSLDFRNQCDAAGISYQSIRLTRITKELRVLVRCLFFFPAEVFNLYRTLKKENIVVVHVSGGCWQFKGVLAGKLAGKKVIWHLNDTYSPKVIRCLFSFLNHLADSFIYASVRTKEYYSPLISIKKKGFVIPAPVDIDKFFPNREYPEDASLIDSWSSKIVIGVVANINPIKGLELFIEVAAELNKVSSNYHFVVVGPVYNSQKNYFSTLSSLCVSKRIKNIEFVGGRSDVRAILKRFDIYVCSSVAESSPISVWEAMSMSKPIVSTDVGDVPLYVKDNYNGFIVNNRDLKLMVDRISYLAINDDERIKLGANSRMVIEENLQVSVCAEKHLSAYREMLGD